MSEHTPTPWQQTTTDFQPPGYPYAIIGFVDGKSVPIAPNVRSYDAELIVKAVNAYGPLVAVRDAARHLTDYYEKSVNVGPGRFPNRETLLWGNLRQALKDIGEDTL